MDVRTGLVSDIEISLLLEAIFQRYGYDFREYSKAHVKRRIMMRLRLSGLDSVSMLQHQLLHDSDFAQMLLKDLSINVTEMFRDPYFYNALRQVVVPILKTWSFVKVWHAGCSTGEEVYSMAILLKEEGLYDRTQIYATDFNPYALEQAKEGIYAGDLMERYALNYQMSGGKGSFTDYYYSSYDSAIIDASLRENIVWAHHNLVSDSDFTETHLVVCRNVLIYFNKDLQNKVHGLFHSSLVNGGVLCLGSKEGLQFTAFSESYEVLDKKHRVFKKRYS